MTIFVMFFWNPLSLRYSLKSDELKEETGDFLRCMNGCLTISFIEGGRESQELQY